MHVSPAAPAHISPYVQQLNAFKIANNNFLIRSVIGQITAVNQPQYAFGSEAAFMDSLSQTLAVLKQAYNSGLYGYEKGWTGTHIDTKA